MNRRLLWTAAALAAVLGAPEATAQQPRGRSIELSLCALRYVGELRTLNLKRVAEAEPEEVAFYQGGFGPPEPVAVIGGAVPVFASEQRPDGTETWKAVASIPVPAKARRVSVILLPDPGTGIAAFPYRAYPLPGQREFAFGTAMLLNLTEWNLSCLVGKKAVAAAPGRSTVFTLKPEVDAFDTVPVQTAFEIDGSWRTIHTTRWNYHERIRSVCIAWIDPQSQRPEITTLREIRDAITPPPPAS